jgi:hypothetical protein
VFKLTLVKLLGVELGKVEIKLILLRKPSLILRLELVFEFGNTIFVVLFKLLIASRDFCKKNKFELTLVVVVDNVFTCKPRDELKSPRDSVLKIEVVRWLLKNKVVVNKYS